MFEIWFWFWAVLAAILIVLEIFTAGFFMLPFGLGAATAAVLSYLQVDVGWQWAAFLAVSTVSLVVLRRFADRMTHEPPARVAADRMIGKEGIVLPSDPDSSVGMVRVESEEWRAESEDRSPLEPGTHVYVDRVEGTRLIVHPVRPEEEPS